MFNLRTLTYAWTLLAGSALAVHCRADDHAAVYPYLADDLAAVVYVDLEKLDVPAAFEQFAPLLPGNAAEAKQAAVDWQSQMDLLRQLGVGRVYLLLRTSDVAHGGPTWVAPIADGGKPEQVRALLNAMFASDAKPQASPMPSHYATVDGYVLAAARADQLTALEASRRDAGAARDYVKQAFDALASHSAAVVVFGDADSRRVVREMFPQLPSPFEAIDGRLIADGLQWGGVTLDLPPKLEVSVVVQAKNEQAAKTVERLANLALDSSRQALKQEIMLGEASQLLPGDSAAETLKALSALKPQVRDARVSLTLGDDVEELQAVTALLAQSLVAARKPAYQSQRMNQFKQIALAFHVYADANKSFPPQAITNEQGRPLLSWRVAILPFLDQNALYKKFRLDEPWDSEHNRKLISQMPDIFADPDPTLRRKIGKHCTTYLVPSGERTVFHGDTGMTYKEITDGTSATVMLVEVVPQRAVVWTKPDDWEVDFDDPWQGVRRDDGRPFTTAFCDGSARLIGPDEPRDADNWPKLLTPTGGETVRR